MARIARVVAPGLPHHVTQRGNRRQQTFFCDDDYRAYLELMAQWCSRCVVEIWAYCPMPNHLRLIAFPEWEMASEEGSVKLTSLYTLHQFSRRMAGPFMARTFCLLRDERKVYLDRQVPPSPLL